MVLIFVLTSVMSGTHSLWAQDFVWARALVGKGQSNPQNLTEGASTCFGLVTDDQNNVYITGICNDSVDFDPGPDTSFVVAGQNDIFLAKYTPSGTLIWRKVLISQSMNYVEALHMDAAGNLLIIGSIQSDVDFDPGPGVALEQVPTGMANKMIIAKYTSDGDFLWVKGVGGPFATWGNDLETDPAGNIYVTGSFYDSLDLDPGAAEYSLVSNGLALFFSKYTANGDLIWARHIPNSSNLGGATDIDLSEDGDVFISGYFGNTLDFDPGPGSYLLAANTTADRYFAKYTNAGDFVWARRLDVNNNGVLTSSRSVELAVDEEENVYLIGDFSSSVDFDPGPFSYILQGPMDYVTYLCKYDADGLFLWAKMITGGFCVAYDIQFDCAGNLNLTGCFLLADFDPGPQSHYMQSSAPSAFMNFFAQYDPDGQFLWARRIGNNGYGASVAPSGIHVKNGYQYVYGSFRQSGDFNPDDNEEYWLTMGGIGWNAYFTKYAGSWSDHVSDTTICDDQEVVLMPQMYSGSYIWQDGSTDSTHTTSTPGVYWVTQTKGACSQTDTFFVNVAECGASQLWMPNVFTPDDDGINDVFLPINAHNVSHYSLTILNRWGNLLFESHDKQVGWTGVSGNRQCEEGTYYWVVYYTDHEGRDHRLHGFLHLER